MALFSIALSLFLIMDPLGNMQSLLGTIAHFKPARQKIILMREMLIALFVILCFNFLGEHIFKLLKISQVAVYFASGIILFLVAIKILFREKNNHFENKMGIEEPFLVPIAIPMVAGPALLATVMLYADTEPSIWVMFSAILIAWTATCILLFASKQIVHIIGTNGLTACEKLMGMILILLSVQRILQGVIVFHANAFPK